MDTETENETAAPIAEIQAIAENAIVEAEIRAENAEAVSTAIVEAAIESEEQKRMTGLEQRLDLLAGMISEGLDACQRFILELTERTNALTLEQAEMTGRMEALSSIQMPSKPPSAAEGAPPVPAIEITEPPETPAPEPEPPKAPEKKRRHHLL